MKVGIERKIQESAEDSARIRKHGVQAHQINARLEIEEEPVRIECKACGPSEAREFSLECPSCGGPSGGVGGGDSLRITSIDIDTD